MYVSPLPLYELIMEIQNTQEIERTLCVLDLFSERWQSTLFQIFFFFFFVLIMISSVCVCVCPLPLYVLIMVCVCVRVCVYVCVCVCSFLSMC